jgi:hypothetical protein
MSEELQVTTTVYTLVIGPDQDPINRASYTLTIGREPPFQ